MLGFVQPWLHISNTKLTALPQIAQYCQLWSLSQPEAIVNEFINLVYVPLETRQLARHELMLYSCGSNCLVSPENLITLRLEYSIPTFQLKLLFHRSCLFLKASLWLYFILFNNGIKLNTQFCGFFSYVHRNWVISYSKCFSSSFIAYYP